MLIIIIGVVKQQTINKSKSVNMDSKSGLKKLVLRMQIVVCFVIIFNINIHDSIDCTVSLF